MVKPNDLLTVHRESLECWSRLKLKHIALDTEQVDDVALACISRHARVADMRLQIKRVACQAL